MFGKECRLFATRIVLCRAFAVGHDRGVGLNGGRVPILATSTTIELIGCVAALDDWLISAFEASFSSSNIEIRL